MDIAEMKNTFDRVINEVVENCRTENGIVNRVIRDDVFNILEQHCYVVYYPLENEDINGFHVTRTMLNQRVHFVFINTWNTDERQVFTAAHELGHIWNAYLKVKKVFPEIDEYAAKVSDDSPEEFVSNKFAAQLLMPLDLFTTAVNKALSGLDYNGKMISRKNMLRLIASLMDTFLVDYKAVTKRLVEIGRLRQDVYNIVKEYEYEEDFNETFDSILKEGNYKRLTKRLKPNKNIPDLVDIISTAENNGCELITTIETLKREFEISTTELSKQDGEVVF